MENKIVNKNEGCKISASEKKKYKPKVKSLILK
jgi:hypothetical protein